MSEGTKLLLQACKNFVKKVEDGKARSVRSYAEMKIAIQTFEKEQEGR